MLGKESNERGRDGGWKGRIGYKGQEKKKKGGKGGWIFKQPSHEAHRVTHTLMIRISDSTGEWGYNGICRPTPKISLPRNFYVVVLL